MNDLAVSDVPAIVGLRFRPCATPLYRSLGFEPERTFIAFRKPM